MQTSSGELDRRSRRPSVSGAAILSDRAGIPTFEYPDAAGARLLRDVALLAQPRRALRNAGPQRGVPRSTNRSASDKIVQPRAGRLGAHCSTEVESKQLLAAYGIPVVPTRARHQRRGSWSILQQKDRRRGRAQSSSPKSITHKSDVAGVKLSLHGALAVRRAYREIERAVVGVADPGHNKFLGVTVQPMIAQDGYELILGSSIDSQFGPVPLRRRRIFCRSF